MKNPLVSIVVVNWNGAEFIAECLNSLQSQAYKNIEIILVDNNSSDNSRKIIKSKFSKVKLIESKENLGFAGGNNLGMKYVKGEYVLLFNSDAKASKNTLVELVSFFQSNTKAGVVQPKIIYKGNPGYTDGVINSVGCYFTYTGFLYYFGYGKNADSPKYSSDQEIFSAYGACMLVRKEVIDKVGLFDDDFFLYFEETDFCMRVWLSGYQVWYTGKTSILHSGGVSSRKFGSPQVTYHSYKNRICSYLKNLEIKNLIIVMLLLIPMTELAAFMFFLTGKTDHFFMIQKSLVWNIKNIKNTFIKREYVQSELRRVKDVEFIPRVIKPVALSYYYYLFMGLQNYKD